MSWNISEAEKWSGSTHLGTRLGGSNLRSTCVTLGKLLSLVSLFPHLYNGIVLSIMWIFTPKLFWRVPCPLPTVCYLFLKSHDSLEKRKMPSSEQWAMCLLKPIPLTVSPLPIPNPRLLSPSLSPPFLSLPLYSSLLPSLPSILLSFLPFFPPSIIC